jgi:nitrogen fixation/metabolism regulation signal transduction histidine kinase
MQGPSRNEKRWWVVVGAAVALALASVLIFLLTQATNNRELYERNYQALFILNLVVATLLLLVIVWMAVRLLGRLRKGKFGSRLLLKIAAIFAVVGFLPGLLIYGVSYQFVSRSIENWFDVKVEGALSAGLSLGRSTLDTLANDLGQKTRAAALVLGDTPEASLGLQLERIREQLAADDVIVWSASGVALASAGESRFQLTPQRPEPTRWRQLRTQSVVTDIEGLEEAEASGAPNARVRAWATISSGIGLLNESRVLQVTKAVPITLAKDALAVDAAYREYQERALGREGLRRMYIGTLTLSLFLAVFGAVLLAVLLGNQLARPLLLLAEGMRDVAAGDLSPKKALQGRDELEGLTRSFAEMTRQLAEAQAALDRSMEQVYTSRANLQTILDNLTAGVLVLDVQGVLRSSNPGATRILRLPLAAYEGRPLADVQGLGPLAAEVARAFKSFLSDRQEHSLDHWQQSFELQPASTFGAALLNTDSAQGQAPLTLLARGAVLPNEQRLVVFDDISEIVSAQRAQAWGEVARRLAHEIKNPLTPIQLSAERLAMKLDGKLADTDQALLTKSVKTIVDQVDAMKRLVNEFRDYARLPEAVLQPVDLNALVQDVIQLYGSENAAVPIQVTLDPACPPILGDAQQLRQIIHNLLQNAQDATEGQPEPQVQLTTRWSAEHVRVRLSVRDNGPGFPEQILKRAFEPYVTTKSKGTGLGLAVVKKIADDHQARVDLKNLEQGGAQVSLSFQVADAQERLI